jgi:hypothetical protein
MTMVNAFFETLDANRPAVRRIRLPASDSIGNATGNGELVLTKGQPAPIFITVGNLTVSYSSSMPRSKRTIDVMLLSKGMAGFAILAFVIFMALSPTFNIAQNTTNEVISASIGALLSLLLYFVWIRKDR